jgi:hypothetical protein
MAALESATSIAAFWKATAEVFRENNPRTTDTKDNRMKEALVRMPFARVTWICALFLLGYVGVEVALGGWIVKFMLEVRHAGDFASGMTATGFWMGITVGRVVLGFVTPRIGEKTAIAVRFPYSNGSTASVYSGIKPEMYKLTISDLPPHNDGPRTRLLARAPILRVSCSRVFARILSRPPLPRRNRRRDKATPSPPARICHRFCRRVRRKWGSHLSICRRCHCAGKGCTGASADCLGAVRCHFGAVVVFA